MGNQLALIDIVDENGNYTGDAKTKREIHEQGLWHKAAHVWIYNSNGEVLLQLRASDKDTFPGLWDISVAGHTDSGETPIESAVREMKEEIGLDTRPERFEFDGIRKFSQPIKNSNWYENEISYIYFYKYDGPLHGLTMPDGEVEKLEFIPIDIFQKEVNDMEHSKKFVPYQPLGEYYNWVVDEVRKKMTETN
jgi:isopentenyl-diphosphate delta-isomerase type 1